MKPVVVTVTLSCDDEGSRRPGGRGLLFDAVAGCVVRSSSTPFVDAARALLAGGVDPATPLVMRQAGRDYERLALDSRQGGRVDGGGHRGGQARVQALATPPAGSVQDCGPASAYARKGGVRRHLRTADDTALRACQSLIRRKTAWAWVAA